MKKRAKRDRSSRTLFEKLVRSDAVKQSAGQQKVVWLASIEERNAEIKRETRQERRVETRRRIDRRRLRERLDEFDRTISFRKALRKALRQKRQLDELLTSFKRILK